MTALVGLAVTVVAVAGVILNNRRRRACFLLWMFSNAASCAIHLSTELWPLAVRDAIFFALAIVGYRAWAPSKTPPHYPRQSTPACRPGRDYTDSTDKKEAQP